MTQTHLGLKMAHNLIRVASNPTTKPAVARAAEQQAIALLRAYLRSGVIRGIPPYAERKAMREATLAVGRA